MKLFALAIVAAAFVVVKSSTLTEEYKAILRIYGDSCVKETGIDAEKLYHLQRGNFFDTDDKIKNFIFCMYNKFGIISNDGIYQKDVAMCKLPANADREKVSKAIDACMGEKGANPQESAFLMAKCYNGQNAGISLLKY